MDDRGDQLDGACVAELPQFFRGAGVLEQEVVDVERVELAGTVSVDGLSDAGDQFAELSVVVVLDDLVRRASR